MDHFNPLESDSDLHSFLDSELDVSQEQPLFDALASDVELRGEMRDLIAMRNAVHRDVTIPTRVTEATIAAAAGLVTTGAGAGAGAAGTAAGSAAGAVASAGSSLLTSILDWSLRGTVVGSAIVFAFLWDSGMFPGAISEVSTSPIQDQIIAGEPRIDTVIVPALDSELRMLEAARQTIARERRALEAQRQEIAAAQLAVNSSIEEIVGLKEAMVTSASVSPIASDSRRDQPVVLRLSQPSASQFSELRANAFQAANDPLPVQIRMRTLTSGLRSSEPVPSSVREAILPNTAFSVTIPLTEEQRIGLEFGSESFRQQFTSTFDGRPVEFLQVPTLFWLGVNYQLVAQPVEFLGGLRPFVEASAGVAFAQGPLARMSAGLQYKPIGPIAFSLGFDASALSYQHQNTWLSTTKSGFTAGLSLDLGAWR